MILSVGEILFDHFPDYRRAGGAPFNFSYHLKKLGFPVRFVTRVGDDPEGRELKTLLQINGFNEKDLQLDQKHRSGMVTVDIDKSGVPVFDILSDAAFDHLEVNQTVRSLLNQGPGLIYYGTLIQRTSQGRQFMQEVFSQTRETVRFLCDINLRPECYSLETVEESLRKADILKLNQEEMATITSLLGGSSSEDGQCHYLMERYGIQLVALTRGDKGSEIHDNQGRYSIGQVEGPAVFDTVGAGDAYSSILAIGYLGGWHPERILAVASKFAADICGIEGALPDTDLFYNSHMKLVGDNDIEG